MILKEKIMIVEELHLIQKIHLITVHTVILRLIQIRLKMKKLSGHGLAEDLKMKVLITKNIIIQGEK